MRWISKLIVPTVALLVASFGYVTFTTVCGTPIWFDGLLDRQAVITVLQQPELMTQIGYTGLEWLDLTSGELGGYSLEGRSARYNQLRRFRSEILQWNRVALTSNDQMSYDTLLWSYDRRLADEKYPWLGADGQLYPVNQASGVQTFLPEFMISDHRIIDLKSARSYVARLRAMGPLLDAVSADVERQAKLGVIPPDFIIEDSVAQMNAVIAPLPERNVLATNLTNNIAKIGLDERVSAGLANEATAALRTIVYPAYGRLIAEEKALQAHSSHDAGLWRLKGGEAYYADQLRYLTSTDMTPDEIHAYGVSEVARISAQIDELLKSEGRRQGPVGARMDALMADPRFIFSNTEDGRSRVMARYRQLLLKIKVLLPKYFTQVPAIELDVRRVSAFSEKDAAGAYYNSPSFDGSRPGVLFVNQRNLAETPMWAMPTLAYHEGIPGHHLQTATALANSRLPLVTRLQYIPAYDEGWALYAEGLASEMGLYKSDPYGELGRLQSQLFRAARLVVDTGLHARHWSREHAIEYLKSTTGMANSEVVAEVDRYIVWPGQACSYTIGLRVMLDLRRQAMAELGPRFNLKDFHAKILENGPLPLWLLQENVRRWIRENRQPRVNSGGRDSRLEKAAAMNQPQ